MAEILGITAFLLALTGIIVGSEALRRIGRQNQSYLNTQAIEFQAAILENDRRLDLLEKEIRAAEKVRAKSAAPAPEKAAAAADPKQRERDRFVPSQYRASRRDAA